jgi:hypothetical protein
MRGWLVLDPVVGATADRVRRGHLKPRIDNKSELTILGKQGQSDQLSPLACKLPRAAWIKRCDSIGASQTAN